MGPPTLFTIPVLRYMKTYGLTHEQLAMVSVVQCEWAAKNPRATATRISQVRRLAAVATPEAWRWHARATATSDLRSMPILLQHASAGNNGTVSANREH